MFRLAPIIVLAPFLGAKLIPGPAKIAIAISLTFLFLPTIILNAHTTYMTDAAFVMLTFKELIIGFILGFFAAVPFYVAQSAGIYIDHLRGSSMLMAQDPTMQAQVSSIGVMFNYYLIVLFYAIDGPLFFFNAIGTSFQVFPVDAFMHPDFYQLSQPFWQAGMGILSHVFSISLQLAAPSLIAILMGEAFLGIANRLAPQVQIAFLGMSIKSLLGLTLLWAAWYIILQQMSSNSLTWIHSIENLILKSSIAQ